MKLKQKIFEELLDDGQEWKDFWRDVKRNKCQILRGLCVLCGMGAAVIESYREYGLNGSLIALAVVIIIINRSNPN